MGHSSAACQLALWVGRRGKGTARLRWAGRELVLYIAGLQVIGVEGNDDERLASAFGLSEEKEWFAQARAAVASGQVLQAEGNAVVKRALSEQLRAFLLAPDAEVTVESVLPIEPQGLTISYPHLVVEMVLGPGGEELAHAFLPEPALILRRLPDFARRAGALGLTEEGMAILAKINDQRSAQEIADPSPHGREVALTLLSAAVGAGLAEPVTKAPEAPLSPQPPSFAVRPRRRRVWPAVVLVLLALAVLAVVLLWLRPWQARTVAGGGGPWAIAVDAGCQPAELERLYRRQERDRINLRVVPLGVGGEKCYRLVWGRFPDRAAAERAAGALPGELVARGFPPQVVRADTTSP
jgi:hypothetical protein